MIEMTALTFLLMGAVALVSPHSITRWVAITALPVPARNEVRAVYGGYGVAMAVLLVSGPEKFFGSEGEQGVDVFDRKASNDPSAHCWSASQSTAAAGMRASVAASPAIASD